MVVCMGNICRSPMGEGLLIHFAREAGLADRIYIESAGCGDWHVGEQPDPRMQEVADAKGIAMPSRAQKLSVDDLQRFDYVIGMDEANMAHMERLARGMSARRATLVKMREFDPEVAGAPDVDDPYTGGMEGFEHVYGILHRSMKAFLGHLQQNHKL